MGLYWNDSAIFPTGMYRCEIPDASGILHNVSAEIYSAKDINDATTNSTATVAGAVVGVLLALVLMIAAALVVVVGMGRLACTLIKRSSEMIMHIMKGKEVG